MSNQKTPITTTNPTNGKVLSTIKNAHAAFLDWRTQSFEARGKLIKAIGKELQHHKTELAELMTDEMGKLVSQSKKEVDLCSAICTYCADNAASELQREERTLLSGGKGIITYAPLGIIYGIQPWNYPSYQVIRYAIANLMVGNSVLLKHASNVTGTAKLLEKIFKKAGLPDHLFTVLIIDHDQSDLIINHNLVRGITLTGSPDAGKIIGEKAGAKLKKTVLELGSNDAYLILKDADIEKAVEQSVRGRIYNNGETCIAAKRFIAVDAVYEAFKKAFVKAMSELKIGDPKEETTELGPMAREDLRDELHKQVTESISKGATLLCGGQIPDREGYYYPATVLANAKPGQPAYDDELFGPVATLLRAKDDEDAMRIANDSRFGLGGGIFSENVSGAIEMAEKYFDTGMVFINTFGIAEPSMPFGGVKNSGYGREHGGFGMKEFVNIKSIIIGDD